MCEQRQTLLKRHREELLLVVEAATVGTFAYVGTVTTVLGGNDLSICWIGAHCARQRQKLEGICKRDPLQSHRRKQRGRLRFLILLVAGSNLHVRAEATGFGIDVHAGRWIGSQYAASFGHLQILKGLFEG